MFGPPGAGKGTQCSHIADKYGLYKLSTGDMIRQEIKNQTEIGKKIQAIVESGELPDSNMVNEMVANIIDQHKKGKGFVFDGYPRTLAQGQFLDAYLQKLDMGIDRAVMLDVDEDNLLNRILGRYSCAACGEVYSERGRKPHMEGVCDKCGSRDFIRRADDTEDVMRTRLHAYRRDTEDIISYYDQQGRLIRVEGNQSVADVTEAIDKILDEKKAEFRREVC